MAGMDFLKRKEWKTIPQCRSRGHNPLILKLEEREQAQFFSCRSCGEEWIAFLFQLFQKKEEN